MDSSDLPQADEAILSAAVRALLGYAGAFRYRATLVLSGDAAWTLALARHLLAAPSLPAAAVLGTRSLAPGSLPVRSPDRLLGRDIDLLVYDAHGGFDPDGFGAATGAIRGGGLLVLLTPPLAHWPARLDPEAERIAVWPSTAASIPGRFIQRLASRLRASAGVILLGQDDPGGRRAAETRIAEMHRMLETRHGATTRARGPHLDPARPATDDQARTIAAILDAARGPIGRPLVIRAHRGRGKSAALGLAAAELLLAGPVRILVTAPRRSAAEAVFRHAQARLALGRNEARSDPTRNAEWVVDHPAFGTRPKEARLAFRSPAELVEQRPAADLLLVDEAAGIPAPLLEGLLVRYARTLFATTVHGYEGTGRGFDVRFRCRLDRLAPRWREIRLEEPIRWAPGDPLEALTFDALLLDAAPTPAERLLAPDAVETAAESIDRAALLRDEPLLRALFGLLVLAHYQTRPLDLRMLLDGPNVRIYAVRRGGHPAATLLAGAEGGFTDPDLREAVYLGRRRPRGHLLPQTLSAHAGLLDAPALRFLRVIRIAVHPALTRRGLGRALLSRLGRDAGDEGFDLLGASFGATPELIRFWDRCGFRPAQAGTRRNAASGEHAVVVLRPLTDRGRELAARAERRLAARLPVLLAGPLRALDPVTAAALLAALRVTPIDAASPTPAQACDDARELDGFVAGHRTLEATLPLLSELTRRRLGPGLRTGVIPWRAAALLTASACQLRPVGDLARHFASAGREPLLAELRAAARALQEAPPDSAEDWIE